MPPFKSKKTQSARPNDILYDPLFTFSSPKDKIKAAMVARLSTAKFEVSPIFKNMFSDLPRQPSQQIVMRKTRQSIMYETAMLEAAVTTIDTRTTSKSVDVDGADRHLFFFSPVLKPESDVPSLELDEASTSTDPGPVIKRDMNIQTVYRESSAQTSPWQPDPQIMDSSDAEILKLDFLKWGSGLPAGMHEVALIERARMKRQWQASMPLRETSASLKKRRGIIEALERDEWAFRESEIQDIQNLRMELLEQMLIELLDKSKSRADKRMEMVYKMKQKEKEEKIKKLRHNKERELRKLDMKQRGITTKYKEWDVIKEHADRTSELYAPLMRHGEHPKRFHQVIDDHLRRYRAQFIGVENFNTLPRWLDKVTKMQQTTCKKLKGTRLCIRETKWTVPVLKQLHQELQDLRNPTKKRNALLERIRKEEAEMETPEAMGEEIDDYEEDINRAVLLLQSVLRGRATQMKIYEGRDRCRELIQELRSTHALQEAEKQKKYAEEVKVRLEQRDYQLCVKNAATLQEALKCLSGTIVGSLLDFLNKELRRLLEERKAHAMCLLAERERYEREAAEAGRRQIELQRRKEHDEMFKQIVKVRQDTVELYLQDIITEGMTFVSDDDAREYVTKLAEKIDKECEESKEQLISALDQEELVADLVHNFLLPEVEKEIVREKVKLKQKKYLIAAHDEIYNKMETLPKPPPRPTPAVLEEMKTQHYPKDICAEALAVEEEDDEKSVATQIPCPGDADVEYILLSQDQTTECQSIQFSVMKDLCDKSDDTSYLVLKRVGTDTTFTPSCMQDIPVGAVVQGTQLDLRPEILNDLPGPLVERSGTSLDSTSTDAIQLDLCDSDLGLDDIEV